MDRRHVYSKAALQHLLSNTWQQCAIRCNDPENIEIKEKKKLELNQYIVSKRNYSIGFDASCVCVCV